jgi:Mg2+ and Co2+ transporter CorA
MKRKITKEHRLLDDTDLNNINNTFKDIKHDNNNNFNRIDNTFKLIEKTCDSMNERMNSLEKSTNTRIDSLEKSVNNKHNTLVILISAIGILLTILKVFL